MKPAFVSVHLGQIATSLALVLTFYFEFCSRQLRVSLNSIVA